MEIMKNMATYLVSKLRNKIYVSVANISIMIVFWCLVYNVSGSDFSEVMSFTWKFDLLAAEVQVRTVGEGGGGGFNPPNYFPDRPSSSPWGGMNPLICSHD